MLYHPRPVLVGFVWVSGLSIITSQLYGYRRASMIATRNSRGSWTTTMTMGMTMIMMTRSRIFEVVCDNFKYNIGGRPANFGKKEGISRIYQMWKRGRKEEREEVRGGK